MDLSGLRVKELPPVLTATSLIDVCLSKTQRKTPTEIHKKSNISIIKKFYIRKIKACSQFFNEKLKDIITLFPKLDAIHPFYADMLNILYDRDHYKLALGQVSTAVRRIDRICKEYITLSKYSDSLYKSKSLKIAAFGRYCTVVKKLAKVFLYLEQVRTHMQRLPIIETSTRTILLSGFPNVGKSSFVNSISQANVEVQPYAFTTKSLYVGHFDYCYTRWQVIDTPGILDHPLEQRNLIEMLAITALTHLHSVILFVIDISEECGFSVLAQINLFKNIQVLFKNKRKVILLNKIDKVNLDDLDQEIKDHLKALEQESDITFVKSSTLTGDGVDEAKSTACNLLLQQRMLDRAASAANSHPQAAAAAAAAADGESNDMFAAAVAAASVGCSQHVAARLHITKVDCCRQPNVPESVLQAQEMKKKGLVPHNLQNRILERDIEDKLGGPGVYSVDMKKNYILKDHEWKYDAVPEIYDGKNIKDFYALDIKEKLQKLREEENLILQHEEATKDARLAQLATVRSIRSKLSRLHFGISKRRMECRLKWRRNGPRLLKKTKKQLQEARERLRKSGGDGNVQERDPEGGNKRGRSVERSLKRESMDSEIPHDRLKKKIRTLIRSRSVLSTTRASSKSVLNGKIADDINFEDSSATISGKKRRLGGLTAEKALKLKRRSDKKFYGKKSESDRFIAVKKIKHLMSGKRGIGKTDRR